MAYIHQREPIALANAVELLNRLGGNDSVWGDESLPRSRDVEWPRAEVIERVGDIVRRRICDHYGNGSMSASAHLERFTGAELRGMLIGAGVDSYALRLHSRAILRRVKMNHLTGMPHS